MITPSVPDSGATGVLRPALRAAVAQKSMVPPHVWSLVAPYGLKPGEDEEF